MTDSPYMPQAIWNIPPKKEPPATTMTLPRYEAYILEQRNVAHRATGLLPIGRHLLVSTEVFFRGWWLFLIVGTLVVFGSRSIIHILEDLLKSATGTALADLVRFIPSDRFFPNIEYTIPSFANDPGALWLVLGLTLSLVVIQLWGVATIIAIISSLPTGGVGNAIEQSTSRLISYLILSLLNLLTIVGGLFLLVLPGLIAAVWFLFSPFVHVVEGMGVADSFVKSRQLVQGYGLLVLLRLTLLILLGIGLTALASSWDLGARLLPILLLPFNVIFLFLLYENLRLLKRDLPREAAMIEGITPESPK